MKPAVVADGFSERYGDLLFGGYHCVDRIVLNASLPLNQHLRHELLVSADDGDRRQQICWRLDKMEICQ